MQEVQLNERLIEIDGRIRIEMGPALKEAVATPELLDNAVTAPRYVVGGRDSMGKVIEAGKLMTYLDWYAPHGWYVFRLEDDPSVGPAHMMTIKDNQIVTVPDPTHTPDKRWIEKGHFADLDAARALAATL